MEVDAQRNTASYNENDNPLKYTSGHYHSTYAIKIPLLHYISTDHFTMLSVQKKKK